MNEPTDELTRRYRRLLAWYPRDHRERHGEEMLGVLLAGAGDRTRPSRRETADLLRGALRLHLRRVVGADGSIDHRDVLAIVSLLGPIAMLAGATAVLETVSRWVQTGDWRRGSLAEYMVEIPDAPVWGIWFVVAVLSLFRLRRTAAATAWLGTLGFLVAAGFGMGWYWDSITVDAGWVVLGAVVATALTWSPGPARGWELVGGRRVAVLVVAAATSVVLVVTTFGTYGVQFIPMGIITAVFGAKLLVLWSVGLAVFVAGAVAAAGVRTREGRRAALVLCVPIAVSVLMLVLPRDAGFLLSAALGYGVPVVALLAFGSLPRRVRAG